MRIRDWSSAVCSSDLATGSVLRGNPILFPGGWLAGSALDGAGVLVRNTGDALGNVVDGGLDLLGNVAEPVIGFTGNVGRAALENVGEFNLNQFGNLAQGGTDLFNDVRGNAGERSEEHTSELQSLMRISYAVFCLKKKNKQ